MGRITDSSLFDRIHGFLTVYLPSQKCSSPHTIVAYRHAINLYLDFICESTGGTLKKLYFSAFQKQYAKEFLAWMKDTKQYTAATINKKVGFAYSTPLPLNLEGWGCFLPKIPS